MRFSIDRGKLLASLGHLQAVVERRTTFPILSNVLIRAQGEMLSLQATDLDIEITQDIEALVETPGETTVSVFLLYDIIRKLPDGVPLWMEGSAQSSFLEILSGRSRFSLQSLPASEFPSFSQQAFESSFTISAPVLRTLLDRIRFAIAQDETRTFLNGVYVHPIEKKEHVWALRGVATDSHRLALCDIPCPEEAKQITGVTIPRKTILELLKILEGNKEQVEVSLSSSRIQFSFSHLVLTSKLVGGDFPQYELAIPPQGPLVMEVDPKALLKAVDRVSILVSEKGHGVVFRMVSETELIVSLRGVEVGSAEETIPVIFHGPSDFEIAFNPKYLLDVLPFLKEDSVLFYFNDAVSSVILREMEDDSILYLVMPMR